MVDYVREIDLVESLIGAGRPGEAVEQFRELEREAPNDPNIIMNGPGVLIEAGCSLEDASLIREGIQRADRILGDLSRESEQWPHVVYNKANGHFGMWSLRKQEKSFQPKLYDNDLQGAKAEYRRLLDGRDLPSRLFKLVFVNHANCLDHLGRSVEAVEYYDRVLDSDDSFPMALGNKAVALACFSRVAGDQGTFLLTEADKLLTLALKRENALVNCGGPQAVESFKKHKEQLTKILKRSKKIKRRSTKQDPQNRPRSQLEKAYVSFCSKERLFLNFHLTRVKGHDSESDPIFFHSLIEPVGEDSRFKALATYLNQIKEDYATARWLLFQSQQVSSELDRMSLRTTFANVLDYSLFDLYSGLLKTAFKKAADILDKIANFVNEYLDLDHASERVSFTNVWFKSTEPEDKERLHDTIDAAGRRNRYLRGLYDIYVDWDLNGYYRPLREIRNALTHRYLAVHGVMEPGSDELSMTGRHIHIDEFRSVSLQMLKLAKSAIIYLVCMVQAEEDGKRQTATGPILPLYFFFDQAPEYRCRTGDLETANDGSEVRATKDR